MNNLHDQAKVLGCERVAPTTAYRLEWECQNFRILAIKVNELTNEANELIKAHDFKIFVQTVANAIKEDVSLRHIKVPDKSKRTDTDSEEDWKAKDII